MRQPLIVVSLLALTLAGCAARKPAPAPSPNTQPTAQVAPANVITLATYNIEHFNDHFMGHRMSQAARNEPANEERDELIRDITRWNIENQWEIANVILDPNFSPDILAIQEGCEQSDLEYFNRRWLNNLYETLIVFPSNSTRGQTVCMLLKPGLKVVDRKDQYFNEPDPAPQTAGDKLFARGPAFLLVESPTGYRFWVGATHQKSKSGNSAAVTAWRNREAKRTHEIMKELAAAGGEGGPRDVILLGDMNDDLGPDEYEKDPATGGDAVSLLVGPEPDGFVLATRPLAEKGEISFHGYANPRYRSLIDHAVATPDMKDQFISTQIFHNRWTPVASDHYPLLVRIKPDPAR